MPGPSSKRLGESGVAILVTAFALLALIPILGLAIDASFHYVVKAKLSAAADASALAAARVTRPTPAAKSRAQDFFHANFPDGFLDTSDAQVGVDVRETGGSRVTTVTVTIEAPTFFLHAIGVRNTTIRASSTASAGESGIQLIG